jgi:hypothetical protein
VACPFFMPIEKLENHAWQHPARLPLGCGWSGHCTAPGHEGEVPPLEAMEQLCNLGYAANCGRLPQERSWDAVRFAVVAARGEIKAVTGNGRVPSATILLQYVCEREHRPAQHGLLQFDSAGAGWLERHADSRVQKMAECFMETYLAKTHARVAAGATGDLASS